MSRAGVGLATGERAHGVISELRMRTRLVVRGDRAGLSESSLRTWVGDETVEIIADRRVQDRRRRLKVVASERRHGERRLRPELEARLRMRG